MCQRVGEFTSKQEGCENATAFRGTRRRRPRRMAQDPAHEGVTQPRTRSEPWGCLVGRFNPACDPQRLQKGTTQYDCRISKLEEITCLA